MSSTALKALTATTGNRTDCWNTPVEFVGDVVKFFGGPVDLDPALMIRKIVTSLRRMFTPKRQTD